MQRYLPSEIARLVYGYLRSNGCDEAAEIFLRTSPDLGECRQFMDTTGYEFYTRIHGCSLQNIMDEHSAFCDIVSRMEDQNGNHSHSYRSFINVVLNQERRQEAVQGAISPMTKDLETLSNECDSTTTVRPKCRGEILPAKMDNRGNLKRILNDDIAGVKCGKLPKICERVQNKTVVMSLNSSSSDLTQSRIHTSNVGRSNQESVTAFAVDRLQNFIEEKSKTNGVFGVSSVIMVAGNCSGDEELSNDESRGVIPFGSNNQIEPNGSTSISNDAEFSRWFQREFNNDMRVSVDGDEPKSYEDMTKMENENTRLGVCENGVAVEEELVTEQPDEEDCGTQENNITDDVRSVIQVIEQITQRVRERGIDSIETIYEENKDNRLYVLGIASALREAKDLKESSAKKESGYGSMQPQLGGESDKDQGEEVEESHYSLMVANDDGDPYCITIDDEIPLFTRESGSNHD